jgi:uncharacterized protein (TIGR03083 family)
MTAMTPTRVEDIPVLRLPEANRVAATEYQRYLDQIRALRPEDWSKPTDCTRWTVHDLVAHTVGQTQGFASLRENVRQSRLGPRMQREIGARYPVDGLNEVQVRDRRDWAPQRLIDAYAAAIPGALRFRRRLPWPLRAIPVSFAPPEIPTKPLGYLLHPVITRDVWMHRIDLRRATGAPLELTQEHDGRIVADLVREWSTTHADPFDLLLSGPAGGHFVRGGGGEQLELDAVEFWRILSGRGTGDGLLTHPFPL